MGLWIALRLSVTEAGCPLGVIGVGGAVDVHGDEALSRLTEVSRRELADTGITWRPSRYGDGPYPLTAVMIEEGRRGAVLGDLAARAPLSFPLRLIHGMRDPDLDWRHATRLAQTLRGDVQVQLIREGDHRLSESSDLDTLAKVIDALLDDSGACGRA